MLARAGIGSVAVAGGGAGYAYWWANKELGESAVERTLSFYEVAAPCFIQYKWLEFRLEHLPPMLQGTPLSSQFPLISAAEEVERFQPLHDKWAPLFRDKFFALRGFYLKHGQTIGTNMAELFPKRWQDEMQPMLDQVPPKDFETIKAIVEADLGKPMGEVFSGFEELPIGSASIGQVHRAVLRDGNKRVVVKIQYPEVEQTFRGDVFAVKR
jgi:predicted unusual protein kinase regulating ubiquinone biosynthesis (AarF/ABC1/UbiB family)